MKHTVLIVTRQFVPVPGGLSDHSATVARYLHGQGIRVVLVYEHNTEYPFVPAEQPGWEGIVLYRYTGLIGLFEALKKAVRACRPDVALFQYVPHMWGRAGIAPVPSLLPLWIKWRLQIPVVSFLHELYYDWSPNLKIVALSCIHRLQLLFICPASRNLIVTNYKRSRELSYARKQVRIPTGNISARKKDECRLSPYSFPYIAWFGTGSSDQKLNEMARAFCRLSSRFPSLKLVLLGAFRKEAANIKEMFEAFEVNGNELADRIIVRNYVDDDTLSDILSGSVANLFVNATGPSGRRSVVSAYLRSGSVMIAIDGPETDPEFVHERNVILIREDYENSIVEAVSRVLSDEPYKRRIEAGARRLFLSYYADDVVYGNMLKVLLPKTEEKVKG